MPSDPLDRQLEILREDYARVEQQPFQHFYCPILCKDEKAELCLGHVVPNSIPNSCRARIVQRKDVDGFFGTVVEADFAALIQVQTGGLKEVFSNSSLGKKMRPRMTVDGQECEHFYSKNHVPSEHSPAILETGLKVNVPPFIAIGEMVSVDTRSGEYLSRAK